MTVSTIALAELAENGADIDVLRQMVQFMAQRLMETHRRRHDVFVVRIPIARK